ncbi:MAG TPA: DUF1926 domain-containing protein, partial [Planctomycetaceae bacterium]|nr:DUF1926 domain-containing protein [Planctomycetaceae bacterium]
WEQGFVSDMAEAGVEYSIVDDFHFRNAGLEEGDLYGYYLTEDEGRLLKVFPGSERLRYTIPFADPDETIRYLREIADERPRSVVAFGDDGEKFGTWPGTKKHVYQDGWLRRFFDALCQNAEWLQVTTLGETVDNLPPTGKIYLPDASYREMTEWALPPERQRVLEELTHRLQHEPFWSQLRPFLRGGFWRNFRVKYSESSEMYARMLQVSQRLAELESSDAGRERADLLNQARTHLYRAQCNCPYWHGAFGGLYLPHLRNAVYQNLIEADTLLDRVQGRAKQWVHIEARDFDLDARKEIRLAGDRLIAYLAPARGGHLYELDVRGVSHNLLATLNRRPEPYHEKVKQGGTVGDEGQVASIHDLVRFKQPDLDKKLGYDPWPRKALVDHFLEPGLRLDEFQAGRGELGDFVTGVYEAVQRRSRARVEARLSRAGFVAGHRVRVTKTIALQTDGGHLLEILYELTDLPPQMTIHFGVEFNFAGLAGDAPDRYFYDSDGVQLGPLSAILDLERSGRIGLMDEWLGLDVTLDSSRAARIWTFPIQTISQSEGGFELVHQSSVVMPHWEFLVPDDGRWSVLLTLATDTSAAQARLLRQAAAMP